MNNYFGTKQLEAVPMTLGDYNTHRGWTIPDDEDPTKQGYLVKYEDGYLSWSPKEIFEAAYKRTDALSFPLALTAVQRGYRVARKGWNGNGMFIFLVGGSTFNVNREPLLSVLGEGTQVNYNPHIDIKTADGSIAVWTPSQVDMMADDWEIIN